MVENSGLFDDITNKKLPKLESVDFDIIRKCIAPTNILMMNSK